MAIPLRDGLEAVDVDLLLVAIEEERLESIHTLPVVAALGGRHLAVATLWLVWAEASGVSWLAALEA